MHLIIQHTEHTVEIGLFDGAQMQDRACVEKSQASALLIPTIKELLSSNNSAITACVFIGVNAGPGPFTTLRTILATVNGLSYASQVPLIGIDGLDAMLDQAKHDGLADRAVVALFNAFAGDLYFGIEVEGKRKKSWKPHQQLFDEIKDQYGDSVRFVGSGALLYKDLISNMFGPQPLAEPCPLHSSLAILNSIACTMYERKETKNQLLPLYLKTQTVINKTVHFV